jgi:hypothetical protein
MKRRHEVRSRSRQVVSIATVVPEWGSYSQYGRAAEAITKRDTPAKLVTKVRT